MHLPLLTSLSLLLLGAPALAAPACVKGGYATFYTDSNCRENGGQAVSMANAGCLANQYGRRSIYIQGSCFSNPPRLVYSPGDNCNCQYYCQDVPNHNNNYCWNIGAPSARSYRFIGSACDRNNC